MLAQHKQLLTHRTGLILLALNSVAAVFRRSSIARYYKRPKEIMIMKLIGSLTLLVALLLTGCAPSQMSVSANDSSAMNPIGLYVVGSTQILDNGDSEHLDFTIHAATESIAKTFEAKGYSVIQLNPLIPVQKVFEKLLGSFHIDEDTIAAVANVHGCKSFLVVYYGYTGSSYPIEDGLSVYSTCSVYGWLGYSKDADVFSSSHNALNSYFEYKKIVREMNPGASERNIYGHFLSAIANYMFETIPPNPNR